MPWFKKAKKPKPTRDERPQSTVPEGLWRKCERCKEVIYSKELERGERICPKCGFHFRISAEQRIDTLLDDGWDKLYVDVEPSDPLGFKDTKPYKDRLKQYQKRTGEKDALHVIAGSIEGMPVILAVMNYGFMGGSMGSVVGEKSPAPPRGPAPTHAADRRLGVGRRPHAGGHPLAHADGEDLRRPRRLRDEGMPYISILTDPTTGGVTASFAMLGDLNIAEPGALIGFAGPRVIEQTIRESLPEGFQRAEFLLEKGFLDMVVSREEMKETLARVLRHFSGRLARTA